MSKEAWTHGTDSIRKAGNMLETVAALPMMGKDEYHERYDPQVDELMLLQQQAIQAGVGVVALFEGWELAGIGARMSDLLANLDARSTNVHTTVQRLGALVRNDVLQNSVRILQPEQIIYPPIAKRKQRDDVATPMSTSMFPLMDEFWNALCPLGKMTLYNRGWYSASAFRLFYLEQAASSAKKKKERAYVKDRFDRHEQVYSDAIVDFEEQLVKSGYTVVKFFFQIDKDEQERRLRKNAERIETAFKVNAQTMLQNERYDDFSAIYENLLTATAIKQTPWASVVNGATEHPQWTLLNAADARRSNVTILETMKAAFRDAMARKKQEEDAKVDASLRDKLTGGKSTSDADARAVPAAAPATATATAVAPAAAAATAVAANAAPATDATPATAAAAAPATATAEAAAAAPATAAATASAEEPAQESMAELEKRYAHVEFEPRATVEARIGVAPATSRFTLLDNLRLEDASHDLVLPGDEYQKRLKEEQKRLLELQRRCFYKKIPIMVAFEGWDAAGKGGCIKRVARALNAGSYNIFTSPAPTANELAHPFLWRYWTRLPRAGAVALYDRTWYGRVLVERIEGFAKPVDWKRAYDEINAFEEQLDVWGAVLVKLWVNISPDTQLTRYKERAESQYRTWKIQPDDWRNRAKYSDYWVAVDDMFRLTSTQNAPWTILEADDKPYARVKALTTINDAIQAKLDSFSE